MFGAGWRSTIIRGTKVFPVVFAAALLHAVARPVATSIAIPCSGAIGLRRSYASSSSCGPTFEDAVEVACDVASQAAFDLPVGLSLCSSTNDVVAGGWLYRIRLWTVCSALLSSRSP